MKKFDMKLGLPALAMAAMIPSFSAAEETPGVKERLDRVRAAISMQCEAPADSVTMSSDAVPVRAFTNFTKMREPS